MDEQAIKAKLDTLAEYQAHRDLLDADKRNLLDEVTVPAEVEAVVSAGMKKMAEVEGSFQPELDDLAIETKRLLDAIVVPDEIKAALAEIDRKRAVVLRESENAGANIAALIRAAKAEIQASTEAQTRDVYNALAQRRAEIEAEFTGKAEAVDDNIRKLTEEIKADIKAYGASVKGEHYHGVYVRGRITWNTDMMEGWRATFPFLEKARKEGEPSVTLKRI